VVVIVDDANSLCKTTIKSRGHHGVGQPLEIGVFRKHLDYLKLKVKL